jgi:hypothetical protein
MCYEGEWALAIKYVPRFKAIKANYGVMELRQWWAKHLVTFILTLCFLNAHMTKIIKCPYFGLVAKEIIGFIDL